jgi:hypothetical protein
LRMFAFVVASWCRNPRHSQPWTNREIKQLTRRKNKLFKKHQNNKSSPQWKKYKDLKKTIQRKCTARFEVVPQGVDVGGVGMCR